MFKFYKGKKEKDMNNSFSQFIPWDYLINDFTIVNKNNALQRTFKVKNHDMTYFTDSEIREKVKNYNQAMTRLPENFMINYEVQRKKADGYITKDMEDTPYPTQIIDEVRKKEFEKSEYFQCEFYITVTYLLESGTNEKILEMLSSKSGNRTESIEKIFEEKYKFFNEKCIEFINLLKYATLEIEILQKEELMGYLYSTVNPEFSARKKSPGVELGFPLDEYLSQSSFEFGKNCRIRDYYLKTVSIIQFPDAIDPLFFQELEELPFEFRLSTRYIILSESETKNTIMNAWRYHQSKQKNEAQWLYESITKKSSGAPDEVAVEKTREARAALTDYKEGGTSYGYYSFTIIMWDRNLKKLENNIREINTILTKHDFVSGEDRFNVKDSFIAAIPGDIAHNKRKYSVNSFLLAGLIPNSTLYQGEKFNSHLKDIPLIVAKTKKNDVYYTNLHVGQIGHGMFCGESGMGKSVGIGVIAQAFMKYENSQVFLFDYKGSSRVLTACMGGKYYDLGIDSTLKFQPLATINTSGGISFANDWLQFVMEHENVKMTPEMSDALWDTLVKMSTMSRERRTMTGFASLVPNREIQNVLKKYTIAGAYGKYFDGEYDTFSTERFQVFEMDYVINNDKRALPVLLYYIFYKIEMEKLTVGNPTLIGIDESGILFENKILAEKFKDLTVTIRKLNGSVLFAMQNLMQIKDNPIFHVIQGNCKTKIFLADRDAMTEERYNLYQKMGLNNKEIETLTKMLPKKEYLMKNDDGTSKFEFNLSPLEVSLVGATGIRDQIEIGEILRQTDDIKEINLKWVENKFGRSSREYIMVKEVIGG